MRGFIINIKKMKGEDIIVTILDNNSITDYWRFFGARHSILQIGNLVDFETQESKNGFMKNMRTLSQISFPWVFSNNHLLIWQNFITLFEPHLKDSPEINNFYFNSLLSIAKKWDKQNPKRLAIESYISLLSYEGRLYDNGFCYVCEEILDDEVGLMRAFLPAHPNCLYSHRLNKKDIFTLYNTKSTIHLNDETIEKLYLIVQKGL